MKRAGLVLILLLWLGGCGAKDDWVPYAYDGGAVGAFKTLEECQEAYKKLTHSRSLRGCYPRGVNPG